VSSEEILKKISSDLDLIKKALKIVPDRESTISDNKSSIQAYEQFAKDDLNLEQITINNHKSAILGYLNHSNGIINSQTVKSYLDSNESLSWKTNQIKALRKYIRDFLQLGNWIQDFEFSKTKAKIKEVPSDSQLVEFFNSLPDISKIIFLILHSSGLRIGEVLKLKISDIDFEKNMIDASNVHSGATKSAWISFITKQTADVLKNYLQPKNYSSESKLFSVSARSVQNDFKNASEYLGISIVPHMLRTVFAEKCSKAEIKDKYINAFQGRMSQSILAKHYTDYSPEKLREQYSKVEPFLTFGSRS